VFLVLSGFVFHHAHARDLGHPRCLGRYVLRRLLRLYPYYLTVLLLVAGISFVTGIGATGALFIIAACYLKYEVLFYLAFATVILTLIIHQQWRAGLAGVA